MSARLDRGGGQSDPQGIRGHTSLNEVPLDTLTVPWVDPTLIPYLNRMFPDRLSLVESLGSVEAARGARTVVDHLIEMTKEQQDDNYVLRRQNQHAPGADGSGRSAPASGGSSG